MADLLLDVAIPGTRPFRVSLQPGAAPMLLGRADDAAIVLQSKYVSRHHARFGTANGSWWIEDAGSSAGTFLNGNQVMRRAWLHDGDRLYLGNADITVSLASGRKADYYVENQRAGTINMVDGVQNNLTVQERESFLREIAGTRTKATALVVVGFLMTCGGATVYMVSLMASASEFGSVSPEDAVTSGDFFGPRILGVPIGLIGFGLGFVGQFVLVAGIVLHIVAAARRRRVDRMYGPRY